MNTLVQKALDERRVPVLPEPGSGTHFLAFVGSPWVEVLRCSYWEP